MICENCAFYNSGYCYYHKIKLYGNVIKCENYRYVEKENDTIRKEKNKQQKI